MQNGAALRNLVVLVLSLAFRGALAGEIRAVPPADYWAPTVAAATPAKMLLDDVPPSLRIALAAPTAEESSVVRDGNAAAPLVDNGKPRPKTGRALAIGFGRELPEAVRTIELAGLRWHATRGGGRAARVELISPGAAAIRVAMTTNARDAEFVLRASGSGASGQAFGPFAADAIASAGTRHAIFWTPVLEGERATLELQVPGEVDLTGIVVTLVRVSHLMVAGEALRSGVMPKGGVEDIGRAAACEIDLACVPSSQALSDVGNAVGKLVFTQDNGATGACTGTLLNDTSGSFTPYVFSANHCLDSAGTAASLNVYWFFRAGVCGSLAVPAYVLQGGGAVLLARSIDWDWALVRLNQAPPSGTRFSAWRAEPVAASSSAITVHHPRGDLAKWSQGSSTGYQYFDVDGSSFVTMVWGQGSTEQGSSGSGLFTLAPGGYYELRGGLFGGEGSCTNRTGIDYFTRIDNMLPVVKQYLAPGSANPRNHVAVAEFYNAALGRYFISADADEANRLDTGVLPGWARTGFRFLAFAAPAAGTESICRVDVRPQATDTGFHYGDPQECSLTARRGQAGPLVVRTFTDRLGKGWIYERREVFHALLPSTTTGACPASTRPVWRFHNATTGNYRYTTEVAVRDQLRRTSNWTTEGVGTQGISMCAPDGS